MVVEEETLTWFSEGGATTSILIMTGERAFNETPLYQRFDFSAVVEVVFPDKEHVRFSRKVVITTTTGATSTTAMYGQN